MSARATNELLSVWESLDWHQRIVGAVRSRVDSAFARRHDRRTRGAASERPMLDRCATRQAEPKEEAEVPDRHNPKEPKAAHTRSILRHLANDERERAQPFTLADERAYPTRSISAKKYPISNFAVSGESEP